MRVLILGGAGMLGHKLWQKYHDRYDTWVTLRGGFAEYERYGLFNQERSIAGVDAFDFDSVIRAVGAVQPDIVLNCIGIIKQLPTAKDPIVSLSVNALLPHRLLNLCRAAKARLIHISTDCVFSGKTGRYKETDISDAEDLYGRTKFLGEVSAAPALTLRTSIIGRELAGQSGLLEWFLSNRGKKVRGYTGAIYTGLTTAALAHIIAQVIDRFPTLTGLYQVASSPINKYDLLCLVREQMGLPIDIEPSAELQIDRSLDGSCFASETGINVPTWPAMMAEFAADRTPYDAWRDARRV